ncbi:DUF3300 domain-containing protein [Edaphobacter modestus]|uniref:Uncharacterized protein DUF3300 n=1 Tax=Edaphobacter modestus TaxID=388466 RepID=A0A4Q7YUM7_9BACT|nr:DUF3300 domain-containing protein [Edaphobacter modestus]RZU40743.1 uncharacterized protein DUF3300 [Edaphobacter modestus]
MNVRILQSRPPFGRVRGAVALLCVLLLLPGDLAAYAQSAPQQNAPQEQPAPPKIPNDQLDSLVAPIALYPDPLLAQVLAASTYPLEIIQLQQWLPQHKGLKDKELVDAVQKQDWDPSVQAMAPLPDVVKQLAENIKWTTDLGNAFLSQQSDVMDAVQRMRAKAKDAGNLKSTEQQKVETKTVENKTVVVIEQAQPQVIYVPSYNPTVVYGPPVYPYPPIVYPPVGAYVAGMAISFGVGMAMGAAWGGGWGYGCGWHGGNNDITINRNNSFVNNSNRTNVNRPSQQPAGGGNNWQHNPQHRGGAPYSNRATANQYGGTARGDSTATRQANARQNQGQSGGRQQASTMDRGSGGANRQQASTMDRGSGGANRPQAGTMDRSSGGADRVGNRSVPSGGSSHGSGAFGGGSGGYSGSSARASSSRGSASMGSRGGGGGRRR